MHLASTKACSDGALAKDDRSRIIDKSIVSRGFFEGVSD
jgi:hypothetical protein